MTEPNDPKNAAERLRSDLPDPDWDEPEPIEPIDPDDELLFSLLDGELTDEKRREVERRLKEDPAFAARCDKLRQACAIIDSLSPVPDNPELRTTTMAYVSQDAQRENEIRAKKQRRRLFGVCLAMLAAAMAAFGLCGWLTARYYARRDAARELPPQADGGRPEDNNPRPGWPPMYPRFQRGAYRPWNGRGRNRDIKYVLPEELREENLEALDGELLEFGKNIPADDPVRGRPDAKERILYRFITERGVDSFTALLSDRGKGYIEPLPEEQKIRLIGLMILSGLYERLGPQSPSGPGPGPRDFGNRRGPDDGPPGDRRPPGGEPGETPPDNPPAERGFFWKNETTGELAKTLRGLPERQRDELLRLPDEEMYARLLVLHWGIDPQMGRQENGGPPLPRRPYNNNRRGRTIDDWNRFVDDEASGGREGEDRGGEEGGGPENNGEENNGAEPESAAEENPAPEQSAPEGEPGEP